MPVRQFLDKAQRVLALPPHVLVHKIFGKVHRHYCDRARVRRDHLRTTYIKQLPFGSQHLLRYLDSFPCDSCFPSDLLVHLVRRYLSHCFDLLGSGWVTVRHGMICNGMESHRYQMGTTVTPDADGFWLAPYINAANLKESQRVWRLISSRYVPIDWQIDFKSGFRWSEKDWYKGIPFVHAGHKPGVDVKVPWELSRMQHLPFLVYGYLFASRGTRGFDAKDVYVDEFRNQILDFIATNPPRFGVNWACTMDVAIRVANWLVSYDLFHSCGVRFDIDFEEELARSVYQHGAHIISNLEWTSESVGNHYLANIVGLLFAAAYLPRCSDTDVWLAFSIQELVKEVGRQFLPDGTNFEASTSYHRLCAEMVVYATALVMGLNPEKRSALNAYDYTCHHVQPSLNPAPVPLYSSAIQELSPFPDWYFERMGLMAKFTLDITRPDGRITQVGDCDNGRFLKLHPTYTQNGSRSSGSDQESIASLGEDHIDHRHLFASISALIDVPGRLPHCNTEYVDTYVIKRLAKRFRYPPHKESAQPQPITFPTVSRDAGKPSSVICDLRREVQVSAYPHFGIYVYTSPTLYLAIRCGRGDLNGIGNHAHNDNLSFELAFDGTLFTIDPGTYVYTPSIVMRNRFRSTHMHNTLVINEREQNDWRNGREGLFQLRDRTNARVFECQPTRFVGEHYGFGTPHRREITIAERTIEGRDDCNVDGLKKIVFQLPPRMHASLSSKRGCVEFGDGNRAVRLCSADGMWSLSDSYSSNGYGLIESTRKAVLETTASTMKWTIEV